LHLVSLLLIRKGEDTQWNGTKRLSQWRVIQWRDLPTSTNNSVNDSTEITHMTKCCWRNEL
jgi:hypothetical protein